MISKTHTKYIQSLHHKKFRDEYALFIGEGPKIVVDLLHSGKYICRELFAERDWMQGQKGLLSMNPGILFYEMKQFELEKISALSTPHSVLAVFEMNKTVPPAVIKEKITLVLDTIQDPGNLGTIIRIADWFGVNDIICSPGCADQYNPKVVQSSMGSIGSVNLHYIPLAVWLQDNSEIKIYAATLNGKPLEQLNRMDEGIIVIGNESQGISEELLEFTADSITIPKRGRADSLNAAVATGIILSHIC